jgi:peroxiredoxin Q/BCP
MVVLKTFDGMSPFCHRPPRYDHGAKEKLMKAIIPMSVLILALAVTMFAADVAPQMPAEGTAAPSFTLSSQDGTPVSLSQFRGKWVVLYFYPKDFTSGCTLEAHNFQRDLQSYEKKNAVILGVSLDPVDSHKGFCTKEGLSFRLLADTEKVVTEKYGSVSTYQDKTYAARNTFLIDPSGVIRKVYLKVKPATHSEEILVDLATLQQAK